MSNKFKETDIKNRIYYFFDDMVNITNLEPNSQTKSQTKIVLFTRLDT